MIRCIITQHLRVGYRSYLPLQARPSGSEVDFCNHGYGIRRDEGGGIPRCKEKTEVLVVINDLVTYLNHISRT